MKNPCVGFHQVQPFYLLSLTARFFFRLFLCRNSQRPRRRSLLPFPLSDSFSPPSYPVSSFIPLLTQSFEQTNKQRVARISYL